MGVFRALFLADTDAGASEANAWRDELFTVLNIIFAVGLSVVVLWAIFLGFKLASATDEGQRSQAKSRLFKALSGVFIIAIIYTMTLAMQFQWLEPVEPVTEEQEQGQGTEQTEKLSPGVGILDGVNAPSKAMAQKTSTSCKATAISILLNIMFNSTPSTVNYFDYSSQLGSSSQLSKVGSSIAADGKMYGSNYQDDNTKGSLELMKSAIYTAIKVNRVPIIIMVTPNGANSGQHWVVCYEMSGSSYKVIDPAGGLVKTIGESSLGVRAGVGGTNSRPFDRYAYCNVVPR